MVLLVIAFRSRETEVWQSWDYGEEWPPEQNTYVQISDTDDVALAERDRAYASDVASTWLEEWGQRGLPIAEKSVNVEEVLGIKVFKFFLGGTAATKAKFILNRKNVFDAVIQTR
jgi:hypothetical protein